MHEYSKTVEGKAKLGIEAFADSLLVIPKVNFQLIIDFSIKQWIWYSRSNYNAERLIPQE